MYTITLVPASAAVEDVIVSGTKCVAIDPAVDVQISLINEKFIELSAGTNVADRFTNLPNSLTATIKSNVDDNTEVALVSVGGTPNVGLDAEMEITVKGAHVKGGSHITIAPKSTVKFEIGGPVPAAPTVVSAATTADGTKIKVTFDKAMANLSGEVNAFAFNDGADRQFSGI